MLSFEAEPELVLLLLLDLLEEGREDTRWDVGKQGSRWRYSELGCIFLRGRKQFLREIDIGRDVVEVVLQFVLLLHKIHLLEVFDVGERLLVAAINASMQ